MSSHWCSALVWSPSHGIQSFMVSSCKLQLFKHCSSIGSSHRVQSIREKLPQCGSLLGHSSCFACVGSPWVAASLSTQPPTPAMVPHRLPCGYLVWCVFPWVAGRQPGSPWSSPWLAGESATVPRVALPPLLHWPWCLQSCFPCIFLTLPSRSCCITFLFLSFQTDAMPSSLLFGSAGSCSGSVLGLSGTSCFWHVGLNFQGKTCSCFNFSKLYRA